MTPGCMIVVTLMAYAFGPFFLYVLFGAFCAIGLIFIVIIESCRHFYQELTCDKKE